MIGGCAKTKLLDSHRSWNAKQQQWDAIAVSDCVTSVKQVSESWLIICVPLLLCLTQICERCMYVLQGICRET